MVLFGSITNKPFLLNDGNVDYFPLSRSTIGGGNVVKGKIAFNYTVADALTEALWMELAIRPTTKERQGILYASVQAISLSKPSYVTALSLPELVPLWRFNLNGTPFYINAPEIGDLVFLSVTSGLNHYNVHALDAATGMELWNTTNATGPLPNSGLTTQGALGSPQLDVVYMVSFPYMNTTVLHALDAYTGDALWEQQYNSLYMTMLVRDDGGVVLSNFSLLNTKHEPTYAALFVNASGNIDGVIMPGRILALDGSGFLIMQEDNLILMRDLTTIVWKTLMPYGVWRLGNTAVDAGAGIIYLTWTTNYVTAVRYDTGELVWSLAVDLAYTDISLAVRDESGNVAPVVMVNTGQYMTFRFTPITCCSGHGTCLPNNTCICNQYYYGDNCSVFCGAECAAEPHRYCTTTGECVCYEGYYTTTCTVYCLANETCSGHGKCIAQTGKCDCEGNSFWSFHKQHDETCAQELNVGLVALVVVVGTVVLVVLVVGAVLLALFFRKRQKGYSEI